YGVTNTIDPHTGTSTASSYVIPRAIDLLSLKRNGSFVKYRQITHISAAIRYVLRSIMLYKVTTNNEAHDKFLSRNRSSGFAYCVQVPAACSIYASYSQLPTLTWASDDFMALRLPGGSIFSLNSLNKLVQDLYMSAEELLRDLCFQTDVPTHYARNLKDDYSIKTAGYAFLTDKVNQLPSEYLWIALQRDGHAINGYIDA
ncbi:hypothetical protein V1525DRAFT_335931, partial [Lipomyces kononenkoae]